MAEPFLRLVGVHTNIGSYHILQGVDLEVLAGGVTVVLGRNGAGKTTMLRTVMGELNAAKGSIIFAGQDISSHDSSQVAQLGVGYVPEQMNIFMGLTVEENLVLAAFGRKAPEPNRLKVIFNLFQPLEQLYRARAGVLSGGQKQMLAIARAMVLPRRLIIIDEPTKGLAPVIVNALADALLAMVAEGTTVLLVEQNLSFATRVGSHAGIMDDGKIVHTSPMATLAGDRNLQQRLLGLGA